MKLAGTYLDSNVLCYTDSIRFSVTAKAKMCINKLCIIFIWHVCQYARKNLVGELITKPEYTVALFLRTLNFCVKVLTL